MPRRRLNKDGTDPFGTEPFSFAVQSTGKGEGTGRQKTQKPADYGKCPKCQAWKIALLEQGDHLVWKEHSYATYGKARFTCAASGQRVCDLPEGEPSLHYTSPLSCTCGQGPSSAAKDATDDRKE